MDSTQSLVQIFSDGATAAAGQIAKAKGIQIPTSGAGFDRFFDSLKATLKDELPGILAEAQEAAEANMGEAFLRYQANVACNELGAKILRRAGFLS